MGRVQRASLTLLSLFATLSSLPSNSLQKSKLPFFSASMSPLATPLSNTSIALVLKTDGIMGADDIDQLHEFDLDRDGQLSFKEFVRGFLPSWDDESDWPDLLARVHELSPRGGIKRPAGSSSLQSLIEMRASTAPAGPKDMEPHVKAQYGIPYPWEEKCVLCQYMVHRAKLRLYQKVVEAETGAPPMSDGGLSPPDRQAIIPTMQMKDVLAKVPFMPSGKQLAKSATEEALQWFCHPTRIPMIYLDFCLELSAKLPMLIEPIFYGIPDSQTCSEIRTCYLRLLGGHDWLVSSVVNQWRRLCGFLGGPRADKSTFMQKIKCFLLSKLWQVIDIQISNGGKQN